MSVKRWNPLDGIMKLWRANTGLVAPELSKFENFPVVIRVNGLRALNGTIVLMTALVVAMIWMINGLTLSTRNAALLTTEERTALLNKYNTYTGFVVTVVSMPFTKFLASLLPVFFLCFSTKAVLSEKKTFVQKVGPPALTFAVSWLLGQGMNAVNVQFGSPTINYIINSNDLQVANTSAEFSFVVTNVSNTTHVSGIPSTDTILRSAIYHSSAVSDTSCTFPAGALDDNPEASIRFGFRLNSWLPYMLPQSVAATSAFSFTLQDTYATGQVPASALPGGNVTSAASLFAYGLWTLWTQFGSVNAMYFVSALNTRVLPASLDAADMIANAQAAVSEFSSMLQNSNTTGKGIWVNVSQTEVVIEFSSVQLSPQITFDSVTFEMPVKNDTMSDWLTEATFSKYTDPSTGDNYYSIGPATNCNDHACVLPMPNTNGTYQDQVRLLRLCMTQANSTIEDLEAFEAITDCSFVSNSSVLIYSVSRHVSVDEVSMPNNVLVALKNPRTTYKVTVGRLTWQTSDLANVYGATCSSGVNCKGLRFPLTNSNQHLVLSEDHLPTPRALTATYLYAQWQILVTVNTQINTKHVADIIYPPNFPLADGSLAWTKLSGMNCSYIGSDFINDIVQLHMYSKDPLQAAYLAGIFWLFQYASVKEIETTVSDENGVRLSFEGNEVWVSSHVSIPRTSAVITIIGCVIVACIGLSITQWSLNAQRESALTNELSTQDVAKMLLGEAQYPKLLVRPRVIRARKEADHQTKALETMSDFEIAAITLRHRTDKNIENVVIAR